MRGRMLSSLTYKESPEAKRAGQGAPDASVAKGLPARAGDTDPEPGGAHVRGATRPGGHNRGACALEPGSAPTARRHRRSRTGAPRPVLPSREPGEEKPVPQRRLRTARNKSEN